MYGSLPPYPAMRSLGRALHVVFARTVIATYG
jgi:hypothetical protein